MVYTLHKYVDVGGTDYSTQVFSADSSKKLSDVGISAVVLNNKGGQYKTTFSEMQRVAVAQARAAFNAHSDYFTGADTAAPDAGKWTVTKTDGNQIGYISHNKLYLWTSAADKYVYVGTLNTISQPFTAIVWAKGYDVNANNRQIGIYTVGWPWMVFCQGGTWYIYTTQGGVLAQRATGGTMVAGAWYRIIVQQTSDTSVTVTIQDVFGNTVWAPGAQTFDSSSSVTVRLIIQSLVGGASTETYYDSFLCWNNSTPQGEQVFEGVIDNIQFNHSPETITLQCLDDAIELERQYDDTYGRVEGTYTCSYGNTDDFDGQIAALLASGWTRTVPTTGIHDKLIYPAGTRRIYAINQTIDQTPILGFYVLPMKHLVCTPGDFISTPDAYTEDSAPWTTGAGTTKGWGAPALCGSKIILFGRQVGSGAGTWDIYYGGLSLGPVKYCNLALYYLRNNASVTGITVRVHTVAGTDYWSYSLPTPNSSTFGDWASYLHLNIHLPDSDGTHGWTATGSPSVNDNIVRIEFTGTGDEGAYMYLDVLYLYTRKKQTSKYTVSNINAITRDKYVGFNRVSVVSSATGSPHTVEDTTRQTLHNVREMTYVDKQITEDSLATYTASGILAAESESEENEDITITVMNPGDMYNLMLGDTITITYANEGLSSATRILYERRDILNNNGWTTILRTGSDPDRFMRVYTALKTKHF